MKEGRREAFLAGKYLSGNPPSPYLYDKQIGGLRIDSDKQKEVDAILTLAETMIIHRMVKETGKPEIHLRRMISDDRLIFYQGSKNQNCWTDCCAADTADAPPKAGAITGQKNGTRNNTGNTTARIHLPESYKASTRKLRATKRK